MASRAMQYTAEKPSSRTATLLFVLSMLTLLFGVATRVPELYETSTLYENPAVYSVVMSDQEESDAPRIQATLRDGDGKISFFALKGV